MVGTKREQGYTLVSVTINDTFVERPGNYDAYGEWKSAQTPVATETAFQAAVNAARGAGQVVMVLGETELMMSDSIPIEILAQLAQARDVIEQHLASTLLAVHLFGSALDGGLKPYSDIDLLVTLATRPDEASRQALMIDLLSVSSPPGRSEVLRALEVTVVVRNDIVPWRYPAIRDLQFGEWLRKEILADIFESAVIDPDLTILLTKARQKSVALVGPPAEKFFDPVPERDLYRALSETLKLWDSPPDWSDDERNVVLTLARIWYSAMTGKIAPKDSAANWAIERLPVAYKPVLLEAQQAYLGHCEDRLASRGDQVAEFVLFAKGEIAKALGSLPVMSKGVLQAATPSAECSAYRCSGAFDDLQSPEGYWRDFLV